MLDFWELLGRLVTDDPFRKEMLDFPNAAPTQGKCECTAIFAPSDYDSLRLIVNTRHPEMTISLLALGEWMLVKTLIPLASVLDDIAKLVKASIGPNPSSDRLFYQALGLSMIDSTFSATFDGGATTHGFALSANDSSVILKLNADQQPAGFVMTCKTFHDAVWATDCKAWMFATASPQGNFKHVHPLDPDEEALAARLPGWGNGIQ